MVGDGDWTTPDLVRFLVSVPSVQQPTGSSAFYRIAAFRAEETAERVDGAPMKYMAGELYEPLDVFRDLGLPVIDWYGKEGRWRWRTYSREGIPDTIYPCWVLTLWTSSQVSVLPRFETVPAT